jgi:hypothetical protein
MTAGESQVTCPLCGTCYSETEGRVCYSGCPLQRSCQLLSCPSCGYEIPAPTRITRWLTAWLKRPEGAQ